MRVSPDSVGGMWKRYGNAAGTYRQPEVGNIVALRSSLTLDTQGPELVLRCECGATVVARGELQLIELARLHFGEFHPDLGAEVPADLILAMAEEKETQQR